MKLKFYMETNKVGSRSETVIEVDDEEWSDLSEAERDDYAKEMFWDMALARLGDWGYFEV